MKQKNKLYIAIGLFLIAISLISGLLLSNQISNHEFDEYKEQSIQKNSQYQSISKKADIFDDFENIIAFSQDLNPTATIEPDLTEETQNPLDEPRENPLAIAFITIETDKRTETYAIMPDVEEETLRNNLGHLPTSVFPGQEGLCVIMGHRDSDLSILKYIEVGDTITVYTDDFIYCYKVTKTEIINSDSELRFDAISDSCIVLVTCYPFYYSGHAPNKIIVYTKLENR